MSSVTEHNVVALLDENRTLKEQLGSLKETLKLFQETATIDSEKTDRSTHENLLALQKRFHSEKQQWQEKIARLKKTCSEQSSLAKQIANMKAELESTKNLLSQVAEERDKLKGDLDGVAEKQKAEIDALNNKLKSASRTKAQAQSQLASNKSKLASSNSQLEALRKDHSEIVQERDGMKTELENLRVASAENKEVISNMEIKISTLETKLEETENVKNNFEDEWKNCKNEIEIQTEANKSLLIAVEKYKEDLSQKTTQHKIASRKSVQLIKELKSQLQKETEKYTALEERNQEDQKRHEEETTGLNERINQLNLNLRNGTSNPGKEKNDSDGVKRALAKRLESLLNENQALKEKVSFLEESVLSVNNELIQLKNVNGKLHSHNIPSTTVDEENEESEEIFI
mmetsp:Transcript_846/g.1039  ORF Transcript_846/g.1039 Transcript_846/m.1039 type:complete len:402 (-) Transcript_846:670-1875(-)|eukprot:CAMPEP_0204830846 /NCGR_PEP_ID=MMETSP1346-20131115/9401_1 /ASSEMBLY_ACC=CAM_ASM_000771 /TAXON_ID=215587 /ORGANISM="Aplanochytrium stocchinoi, Strain GSBS06" /LENGTH=401 /DNA_ID=CAMNT_0051961437 /DNA_START=70 /DNA_END=1275 /DNA_ORIENTATION=+